jgi:hypothetical protein
MICQVVFSVECVRAINAVKADVVISVVFFIADVVLLVLFLIKLG